MSVPRAIGRPLQTAWLGATLVLLGTATAGMAVGYRRNDLLAVPEFATLLSDLNIPIWLAITIGLVLPIVSAATLAAAVWVGRRSDAMALLFSVGLVGVFLFASRATFVLAEVSPAWRPLLMAVDVLAIVPFILVMYLFPTGTFVPTWSRWFAYGLTALAVGLPTLGQTVGTVMSGGSAPSWQIGVIVTFSVTLVASGLVSQVVRYRHYSSIVERQQTRWVMFTLGIMLFLALLSLAAFSTVDSPPAWTAWILLAAAVVSALVPVALAVALFRYHLYDIDRIINRTIVYSAVVALLVAVYAGGVFLLRELLPVEGDLAVAASTLAVAALFNPLRKRVQQFVDRRFYRSRYDAQRVVEEFSHRLAGEIDLEALTEDWLATVDQAVKPETAGVWLR